MPTVNEFHKTLLVAAASEAVGSTLDSRLVNQCQCQCLSQSYLLKSVVVKQLLNYRMKELLKLLYVCQSYRQNKSGKFLWLAV